MINTERLCLGCMNDSGGEQICPICGYDSASQNPDDCLPVKFIVNNRYLIGKVTKINGEGITYIGWDISTDAIVNIKEYFPKNYAHRNPDKTVSMEESGKYTFNEGLMEFMEINRRIMLCDLPSLIPVTDVFEENGTIYAVYKSVLGITLEEFLIKNGNTLKWEQARALLLPLIDTIKGMNDFGIIHGGISSNTIMVGRDGKLRITDYSIKKLRNSSSEIETEIYDGYAAAEQYNTVGLHMDKYTDVYGLSATLFRVFIGVVPPSVLQRLKSDAMSIPAKFAEELPRHVLAAMANGLQIMPANRTSNMETFKNELVYGEIAEPVQSKKNAETEEVSSKSKKEKQKKKGGTLKYVILSSLITAIVFVGGAYALVNTVFKDTFFPTESKDSSSKVSSIDAPVVEQIGSIDSDAAVSAKLYKVENLVGKYYSQVIEDSKNEPFKIVIKGKKYSSTVPLGKICSQSVKAGTEAARDTKIEVVISLGPTEVKIAKLYGFDENTAKMELLKQGFLYDNIIVSFKYDEDELPGVVIAQTPKEGEKVSTDAAVQIIINEYEGNQSETTDSSDSSDSHDTNSGTESQYNDSQNLSSEE